MFKDKELSGMKALLAVAAGASVVFLVAKSFAGSTAPAGQPPNRPPLPVPSTAADQKAPVEKGATVLLLGDSLAVGMSNAFRTLAKTSGYKPEVSAVSGTTIQYWSSRYKNLLNKHKPKLVIVSLGTNDSVLPDPKAEAKLVEQMVRDTPDTSILAWIGPPAMPSKSSTGAPMKIDQVVEMVRPLVADFYYDSRGLAIPRGGDKIHPATPKAYADWFSQVWQWLASKNAIAV